MHQGPAGVCARLRGGKEESGDRTHKRVETERHEKGETDIEERRVETGHTIEWRQKGMKKERQI